MPDDDPHRYLAEAERCLKRAQEEVAPHLRQQWEELARNYRHMAEQATATRGKRLN